MLDWVGCFWWMAAAAGVFHCPVGRPGSQAAARLPSSAAGWRCTEGSVQGGQVSLAGISPGGLPSPTSHEAQHPCVAPGRTITTSPLAWMAPCVGGAGVRTPVSSPCPGSLTQTGWQLGRLWRLEMPCGLVPYLCEEE